MAPWLVLWVIWSWNGFYEVRYLPTEDKAFCEDMQHFINHSPALKKDNGQVIHHLGICVRSESQEEFGAVLKDTAAQLEKEFPKDKSDGE